MRLLSPKFYSDQDEKNISLLQSFGNDSYSAPTDGIMRIGFQNARGIQRTPPAEDVMDAMDQHHISVMGVAEPNCTFDNDVEHTINAMLKLRYGCGKIVCSSAPSSNTGYQPGGIMHIMQGKMLGRHLSSGSCPIGRYSWSTFRGSNDRIVCIITGYRVCKSSTSPTKRSTANTAHWQQVKGLVKRGYNSPNPRKQILTDLSKFIHQHQDKDHDVLLLMDANESNSSKSEWTHFLIDNNLHDIHDKVMSQVPPTTRLDNPERIDFMAASDRLLKHVSDAGYGALNDGLISDHIILWADVDFKSYFGGEGPRIVPPQAREFSVDNDQMRTKFLSELKSIHDHQRIGQRIQQLEMSFRIHGTTNELVKQYNQLDREVIDSIRAAVKRTVKRKQHGHARSPELTKAGSTVLFWKAVRMSKRKQLPLTRKVEMLAQHADIPRWAADVVNAQEANDQVMKAWVNLRSCQKEAVELRTKWLESVARLKSVNKDEEEVAKTLKLLIRNYTFVE